MSRRRLAGDRAAAIGLLALTAAIVAATPTLAQRSDATSSRSARDEALRAIPWKQLSGAARRDVQAVIRDTTIYRRLPTRVIDCDPDLFTFLLQHPDVVVDIWRLMGVSNVALDRVAADTYYATDGAGTTGKVSYVFADWGPQARNLAVIYATGAYEGQPFTSPLRAQSVLVLQSGAVKETNGRDYITVRLDSFVHFDQVGVDLVARTIQPWINKTADRNLIETLGFVSTFSRTAERNPQGMQRLASRLQSVDQPTRNQLVDLCYQTARRYASADESKWTKPYVLAQRVEPEVQIMK